MKQLALLFSIVFMSLSMNAQPIFTKADTLRGSLNENRDWFDIQSYTINVTPDIANKSIQGSVIWKAKVIKNSNDIQIDLQQPLIIDHISMNVHPKNSFDFETLQWTRDGNIALAKVKNKLSKGDEIELKIKYHGIPKEAIRPPWDGGWIWKKDANGNPWVSVACQGLGASVWYPCKDVQSDEPDSGASLSIKLPTQKNLQAIANGNQAWIITADSDNETNKKADSTDHFWFVSNPINNYNIIPYIGDYIHWNEKYKGLKGNLEISYYALRQDSAKARKQFKQVPEMLKAFEYWFGPYPFYEDGFKIIQSPHLGMEHQSAIAYGNKFLNGYLGKDLSGSGWGMKWDFIIVHESGHEWFANNITTKDIADMWVHEGFTNYSETLFTEFYYGKEAGNEYSLGSRKNILNDRPIIGHYGVNEEGSGDMYSKGASMIHNIRNSIHNDSLFRSILIGMNKDFYHQTVTSAQIENYISKKSGYDFSKVFDQYLRTIQIPEFNYSYDEKEKILTYQWKNCIAGFDQTLHFTYEGTTFDLLPTAFIPQKRLIKMNNFNPEKFGEAIKRIYYVELKYEKY